MAPTIVLTGLGLVTPLGVGVDASSARLWGGESGIGPISRFVLAGARSTIAAESPIEASGVHDTRADAMARAAAREALAQAGLVDGRGLGLVVGGTTAGMFETEALLAELPEGPVDDATAARMLAHPLSSTADALDAALGPFERVRTVCCACTSGAAAIALGAAWLRLGLATRVLAGGVDALCRLTFAGFGALGVLDPEPSRPFDRTRAGLTLGEGAGFVVLERADDARRRGARALAILAGEALAGEAHHITNPEPSGTTAVALIERAIARAGLTAADVAYVNAHGTGTPLNDAAEAAALAACFGVRGVAVSSSKGQLGHGLGAAGAIEAIVTACASATGRLPPTVGLLEPEPSPELDHIRSTRALSCPIAAISTSFGFGGTGGALVFRGPVGGAESMTTAHAEAKAGASSTAAIAPHAELVVTAASAIVGGRCLAREALVELVGEPASTGSTLDGAPIDASTAIEPAKARRMDRAGRLAAEACAAALATADRGAHRPLDRAELAPVVAMAFGNVDASTRFLRRVLDKGAHLASPAEFPNLVPSAPVSHAAIACGLRGPAIATPDRTASSEACLLTAMELVRGGLARAAVAGGVEVGGRLVDAVFLRGGNAASSPAEGEAATALVVERASDAAARGGRALARIVWSSASRAVEVRLEGPPAPTDDAVIVASPHVDARALVAGTSWADRPVLAPTFAAGRHAALGGVALVAAVSLVDAGRAERVLAIGGVAGRAYAFVLDRAESA